ncbi:MAG TPA: hypothetical protein VFQ60_02000 [Patescibacteria group bacterium]|nr:hypothetical protein [Patescibacteria group bacterium]
MTRIFVATVIAFWILNARPALADGGAVEASDGCAALGIGGLLILVAIVVVLSLSNTDWTKNDPSDPKDQNKTK